MAKFKITKQEADIVDNFNRAVSLLNSAYSRIQSLELETIVLDNNGVEIVFPLYASINKQLFEEIEE